MHAHAIEYVTRFDAVAELGDRAAAVEAAGNGFNAVFGDSATIQWLESPSPIAQHLLGIVEALLGVASQGLRKEVPQPLSQRGIKTVRRDRGLVLCDEGLSRTIAPGGRDTGDEFMQGDRRGISLRMEVPTALGPQGEEWIEVGPCPGLDVLGRRAGEREIEQDKAQTAASAGRCDADVVGLDIAVGDALLFKVIERLEKIFPKSAHQIERQQVVRIITPQPLGQRSIASPLHKDGGATGDRQRVDDTDDVWMPQRPQNSRFGL